MLHRPAPPRTALALGTPVPGPGAACDLPPAWLNGRLREYPDVRAAFEPWRRRALMAWRLLERPASASGKRPRPN